MEPNSREFYKQCAFQKFCNTVLHNEACDAHRELHRHKAREVTFSDLPLDEARQLHTFDEYFKREAAEGGFSLTQNQTPVTTTEHKIGKVTYLVCSSASEHATDTLDKKIKKLIRKDMELNPANARK